MQYIITNFIFLLVSVRGVCPVPFFRTTHNSFTKAILSVTSTSELEGSANITWYDLPADGRYAYNQQAITIMGSLVEPTYNRNVPTQKLRSSIYGCPVRARAYGNRNLSINYLPPSGAKRWIALVSEGRCMVRDKVNMAYRAGAVGMLMYHSEKDSEYYRIINNRRKDFVVVGTNSINYRNISSQLSSTATSGLTLRIRPGDTYYPLQKGYVSLLCLSIFLLSFILACYGIHCPCPLQVNIPNFRAKINYWTSSRATKLESLETYLYDITSCCICLENFELGSHVTRLPCQHQFHKRCIYEWVTGPQFVSCNKSEDPTCPICSQKIFTSNFRRTIV